MPTVLLWLQTFDEHTASLSNPPALPVGGDTLKQRIGACNILQRHDPACNRHRALRDIGIARETAVKELYELSGKLAAEIAGRIVGRELDAAAHEKLISDTIDELTSKAEAN